MLARCDGPAARLDASVVAGSRSSDGPKSRPRRRRSDRRRRPGQPASLGGRAPARGPRSVRRECFISGRADGQHRRSSKLFVTVGPTDGQRSRPPAAVAADRPMPPDSHRPPDDDKTVLWRCELSLETVRQSLTCRSAIDRRRWPQTD